MKSYRVTLTGVTPLLMHRDNLTFSEQIKEWQKLPENEELSQNGDDRSPAWTWIGCLYHENGFIGLDSDNIMTMLREGGTKVRTGKKQETYKRQTQSGLIVNDICSDFFVNGKKIPTDEIFNLIGENDFARHLKVVEDLGFELLVKRARIGRAKHVRVRPMFRNWSSVVMISVVDEDVSGIKQEVLKKIIDTAGGQCGLCDWRPSSSTPGSFGKFSAEIEAI